MTLGRRLAAAFGASVSDPVAWPMGMLGFLVRGGLVVLALPILTLPSPIGVATLLGPAVISTGRLEGPLRMLVVATGLALAVLLAMALVLAAFAQDLVHARWRRPGSWNARSDVPRLVAVELLAITPLVVTLALTIAPIVDEVRSELLLPGDLAVPLVLRAVSRAALPLGAVAAAVLVTEAIDGSLARIVLVPHRRLRPTSRAFLAVVATAAVGWLATLVVLIPGLLIIGATWEAVRVAWGRLPASQTGSPDLVLALLALVAMVAIWIGVLLMCGLASLVRAHLWTSRVSVSGDWTSVGH